MSRIYRGVSVRGCGYRTKPRTVPTSSGDSKCDSNHNFSDEFLADLAHTARSCIREGHTNMHVRLTRRMFKSVNAGISAVWLDSSTAPETGRGHLDNRDEMRAIGESMHDRIADAAAQCRTGGPTLSTEPRLNRVGLREASEALRWSETPGSITGSFTERVTRGTVTSDPIAIPVEEVRQRSNEEESALRVAMHARADALHESIAANGFSGAMARAIVDPSA